MGGGGGGGSLISITLNPLRLLGTIWRNLSLNELFLETYSLNKELEHILFRL